VVDSPHSKVIAVEKARRSASVIRFGVYELDLRAEELSKNGTKIRLRGQPFQVLVMLLERPGEIVTREELRAKLWPDGTFVDFDHGLNTAINKIREVLGDSAENPRFVETLPRRGYRFIGTVGNASRELQSQPAVVQLISPEKNLDKQGTELLAPGAIGSLSSLVVLSLERKPL
jgi:DNA-binding winged helix-turn-helix (wHTH) protein